MSWREPNRRGLDLEEPADGGPAAGQGPQPLGTGRKVLLGLILAALAVGLVAVFVARGNTGDEDSNSAAPSPLSTQIQSSTPPAASEQPPPLLNTGDDPDWAAMVRSMLAYDAWLRRNPRPELLEAWMRPASPLYAEARQSLENLANGGLRYEPPYPPLAAENVNLTSRHGTSAVVFVRFGPLPALRIIDRAGNTVLDQPAQPPNSAVWTLLRDPDGRWRFEKAERL